MKALYYQILDFTRLYFSWKIWLTIIGFLAIGVSINYYFDLYDTFIHHNPNKVVKGALRGVLLAFSFLAVCGIVSFYTKQWEWWKESGFWLRVLVFFSIWGISSFWEPLLFLEKGRKGFEFVFASRTATRLESMINVVIPIILAYFIFERESYKSIYGLRSSHWDWKPYLILFFMLVFLIGIGSFFNDLQAYYPRYLKTNGPEIAAERGINQWILIGIYELAYGSDFISVELFFRGALVLGFTRYLGGYAVLAMVGSYVFLHFGKPMTETLSSAVGGYILGVIVLNSRNIWGGVVLHVGVAWLMEFFGWLQHMSHNSLDSLK